MNIIEYLDETLNNYYSKNNKYPSKIHMNQLAYNKLILTCNEQDLKGCWIDKEEKNYKGILIDIQEIDEIKLVEIVNS